MLKMMLKPGDFQFINNRTILHGRAAFEDQRPKDQRRHLYRLWINMLEWPRMPASQSTLVAADMARWDALWWRRAVGNKHIEQPLLLRPLRSQARRHVIANQLGGSSVQLLALREHSGSIASTASHSAEFSCKVNPCPR